MTTTPTETSSPLPPQLQTIQPAIAKLTEVRQIATIPISKKKNELTCTILHFIQLSFENLQKSLFYTLNKAILFRKLSLVSKNNLEGAKFANLRLLMPLKSFCKIKFSLVNLKFNFRPL